MDLLQVKQLKKVYHARLGAKGYEALRQVDFSVAAGEFIAIMGASGSGKTTLLNIIASLDQPTGGEVLLEGQSLRTIKDRDLATFRRENLGFVFQEFNLLDTFTLRDNILLPLVLSRMPYPEMSKRLAPLAERLGLTPLLDQFPYEVSGGEKQRAAVARATITSPKLLLADEPTGALDSKSTGALLDSFEELNRQGQTLLMVTHSAMAASRASRVLFIRDGQVFNQLYRGEADHRAFYQTILSTLAVLDGGADVG